MLRCVVLAELPSCLGIFCHADMLLRSIVCPQLLL